MNRQAIEGLIPHRGQMLLLDEVFLEDDGSARGLRAIRGDEFFLDGHFPGNPVVPGVMLCEMMAQTACVLLDARGGTPLFAGLDKVRFRRVVKPGETVETRCTLIRQKAQVFSLRGEARVDGALCAQGEFLVAVQGARKEQ